MDSIDESEESLEIKVLDYRYIHGPILFGDSIATGILPKEAIGGSTNVLKAMKRVCR